MRVSSKGLNFKFFAASGKTSKSCKIRSSEWSVFGGSILTAAPGACPYRAGDCAGPTRRQRGNDLSDRACDLSARLALKLDFHLIESKFGGWEHALSNRHADGILFLRERIDVNVPTGILPVSSTRGEALLILAIRQQRTDFWDAVRRSLRAAD